MAIFVTGMLCGICNKPISEPTESMSFSSIAYGKEDSLALFSDASFHKSCFEGHPLASRVIRRVAEMQMRTGPGNRKCSVCNNEITQADDYLGFGLLAESEVQPLYQYNYLHFHKSHVSRWENLVEFLDVLRSDIKYQNRDKKSGQQWLLKQLDESGS